MAARDPEEGTRRRRGCRPRKQQQPAPLAGGCVSLLLSEPAFANLPGLGSPGNILSFT